MVRALWNGAVIAEAPENAVKIVEGNVYFPPDALDRQYFMPSARHSRCIWKGLASYYDLTVNGRTNSGAPGTIPARRSWRSASRATLLSGRASRSSSRSCHSGPLKTR
jgi:hypothetical protein